MITAITLKNFKCFKEETRIPTNQFNLLTGINGRGKSTALQPLLLFRQSLEVRHSAIELNLNGTCIDLGTFDDIRNSEISLNEFIQISYNILDSYGNNFLLEYYSKGNPKDKMNLLIEKIHLEIEDLNFDYFPEKEKKEKSPILIGGLVPISKSPMMLRKTNSGESYMLSIAKLGRIFNKIHYLSADRLGPQEFHLKKTLSKFPTVGVKGENVVNILLKKGKELVNDVVYIQERKSSNIKNISKDLLTQTGEWLNEIFDGGNIQLEDTKSKIANLLFNTTGKEQNKHNKPANIGFGFSYALPIIVSGLIAKEGEILIVENPEAHLHPRAQSRITKFLAKVSQCGVQVFIETHSDHVLNASRIAVLDDIITNEQLNILYFSDDEKNQVVTIPVKEDGSIEEWPDGFFDQTDKDYERLFGL